MIESQINFPENMEEDEYVFEPEDESEEEE